MPGNPMKRARQGRRAPSRDTWTQTLIDSSLWTEQEIARHDDMIDLLRQDVDSILLKIERLNARFVHAPEIKITG